MAHIFEPDDKMTAVNTSADNAAFVAPLQGVVRRRVFKQILFIFGVWLLLVALFVGVTVRNGVQQASSELDSAGFTMHRVVSQLTAQHDAHLTSLVALITSTTPPPEAAIRQVAQSIIKFYPRIDGIDLVTLPFVDGKTSTVIAVPGETDPVDYGWIADNIDRQKAGRVHTYVKADRPASYFLAKRANDLPAGLAVIMHIDATRLLRDQDDIAHINILLSLDGRTIFRQVSDVSNPQGIVLGHPRFSRVIDNQSQPFVLEIDRPIYLKDVLDTSHVVVFAVVALLLLLVVRFAWQQKNRAKALLLSAQLAEKRAQLREHETRLAHASRVNALGELASGIAHELTQPLTALLSQSQAAVRITAQPSPNQQLLAQALEANVREAKRAGAMLKRMRDYMSNTPPKPALSALNRIVNDVAALTQTDLDSKGIRLTLVLDARAPEAVVDVIEIEQVLHNLVRNAADALQGQPAQDKAITIETYIERDADTDHAVIRVSDSGPGIPAEVVPRLFEPFFTTKEAGMGLGLSLCATLLERVGGRIEGHNAANGGAVFTVILPLSTVNVEVV